MQFSLSSAKIVYVLLSIDNYALNQDIAMTNKSFKDKDKRTVDGNLSSWFSTNYEHRKHKKVYWHVKLAETIPFGKAEVHTTNDCK